MYWKNVLGKSENRSRFFLRETIPFIKEQFGILKERRKEGRKNWNARHLSCIPVFSSFFSPLYFTIYVILRISLDRYLCEWIRTVLRVFHLQDPQPSSPNSVLMCSSPPLFEFLHTSKIVFHSLYLISWLGLQKTCADRFLWLNNLQEYEISIRPSYIQDKRFQALYQP